MSCVSFRLFCLLLCFLQFACCACLEASISAARRSYKPHLPTRVRFADEAEAPADDEVDENSIDDDRGGSIDNRRQSRNPLLFGVQPTSSRSTNRGGPSGLMAHSTYIQSKYKNS